MKTSWRQLPARHVAAFFVAGTDVPLNLMKGLRKSLKSLKKSWIILNHGYGWYKFYINLWYSLIFQKPKVFFFSNPSISAWRSVGHSGRWPLPNAVRPPVDEQQPPPGSPAASTVPGRFSWLLDQSHQISCFNSQKITAGVNSDLYRSCIQKWKSCWKKLGLLEVGFPSTWCPDIQEPVLISQNLEISAT